MASEQRHEAADKERFTGSGAAAFYDAQQVLLLGSADGNDEASAFGELCEKRSGHRGSSGGNDDSVVGRAGGPAERAIAFFDADVRVAEASETFAAGAGKFGEQFDDDNFAGEQREHRGLISGAGADFEDSFGAIEQCGIGHGRDHEGLRDGLSAADGERHIGIGGCRRFGGNEFVAWDGEHGVEDARRADAAGANLAGDHFVASRGEIVTGADNRIGVCVHGHCAWWRRRRVKRESYHSRERGCYSGRAESQRRGATAATARREASQQTFRRNCIRGVRPVRLLDSPVGQKRHGDRHSNNRRELMKLGATLIAALLCTAGPALAQTPAPGAQQAPQHMPGTPAKPGQASAETQAEAPAEKIDPAKEAAIRKLIEITEVSRMGDNITSALTNQVRSVMGRAIPAEQLPKFMDTFTQKFTVAAPSSAVTDAIVPVYARHYSMEDIQGLIKFYETPLGQRVVKTMPDVSEESQNAGARIDQKAAIATLRTMADEYPQLKQMLPPESPAAAPAPNAAPAPAAPKLAPPQ